MSKVLVVDDERGIRDLLQDILVDAGYDVIEADNGNAALNRARHEHPDVIVLDVIMPIMDGFEVLGRLRRIPSTRAIPVILLTALPAAQGESPGMEFGVSHYLTKPCTRSTLEAAVRVAMRESEWATGEDDGGMEDDVSIFVPDTPRIIGTGNIALDEILGGGIPVESLTLIDGASSSGKSVLCQHFTHESLVQGHGVAYFTSENTPRSLVTKMGSLGLDVSDYVREDMLRIHPIGDAEVDGTHANSDEPEHLMAALAQGIQRLDSQYDIIVVDAITNLASYSQDKTIIGFFSACKYMCNEGRTVILVAHSYAFDERMLIRLRALCDAHLSLRVERVGAKLAKMLEVYKIHNAMLSTGNVVSFEVEPGIGMRVIPIRMAKA